MDIDLQLGTLGQIALPVRDFEQGVRFYRDVLRLPFLYQFPPLAFFDCGGVRLLVEVPESPEFQNHSSVLYFKVDDLDTAYAELMRRSVEFIGEPHLIAKMPDHELWMAFFKDGQGNTHALMQERR
jgi:predicted enzyme related to lactoylglutathione lyase